MHRFKVVLLVATVAACERGNSSTPPEPAGEVASTPAPESEPESEPEPEPEPEPAPAAEPEETEVAEAVVSKDGFEARNLRCTLSEPTRNATRYILAGLTDPAVDAALDACIPDGAAIDVEWGYVSGQARNISVMAETSKQANCVMAAMEQVRAGVQADCKAVLLIGDKAAATTAYEAR